MSQAQVRAEATFRARLAELGATLLEPYKTSRAAHRVRCAAGHECFPRPDSVKQGRNPCLECGRAGACGTRRQRTWTAFQARVAELGGTLIEPAYLGYTAAHRAICGEGHECNPRPDIVLHQRQGMCRPCGHAKAGRVKTERTNAWSRFQGRIAELGGTIIEPEWLGSHTPHRAICPAGHQCTAIPAGVLGGGGMCLACTHRDPVKAWARFQTRIAELGGTVIEPSWLGSNTPHRVICAAGHQCSPLPGTVQRGGMCRTCAGQDPEAAERWFRERVAQLGGTVLEAAWLGDRKPHRVRCAEGHQCTPIPTNVRSGQGLCRVCAGKEWDVFYVVATSDNSRIKLGISARGGKTRLRTHRAAGYTRVLLLMRDLPGDQAREIEQAVLGALRLADIQPIRGREYYDASALALVLDVADNYPIPQGITGSVAA
jgi:hypothetical protein